MKIQITVHYILLALYLSRSALAVPIVDRRVEPRGFDDLGDAVKKVAEIGDKVSEAAGSSSSSSNPVRPSAPVRQPAPPELIQELNEALRDAVRYSHRKKVPWKEKKIEPKPRPHRRPENKSPKPPSPPREPQPKSSPDGDQQRPRGLHDLSDAVEKLKEVGEEMQDHLGGPKPASPRTMEGLNEAFRQGLKVGKSKKSEGTSRQGLKVSKAKKPGAKKIPWSKPGMTGPKPLPPFKESKPEEGKPEDWKGFLFKKGDKKKFGDKLGWNPKKDGGGSGSSSSGAPSIKKRSSKDSIATSVPVQPRGADLSDSFKTAVKISDEFGEAGGSATAALRRPVSPDTMRQLENGFETSLRLGGTRKRKGRKKQSWLKPIQSSFFKLSKGPMTLRPGIRNYRGNAPEVDPKSKKMMSKLTAKWKKQLAATLGRQSKGGSGSGSPGASVEKRSSKDEIAYGMT